MVKYFVWNAMSSIFQQNLQIEYLVVPEKNGKFYRDKKKIRENLYENTPSSDRSRILTRMQCHHFCTKTSRQYIQRSQKQVENSIDQKKKKKSGKTCTKMPFCPIGQEFSLEYNAGIFASKHADSIFSGQRKKMENSLKRKNNWCKFCTKMPLVSTAQEFRQECNVIIFARKHVDSIFRGLRNKWKIIQNKNEKE